MDDPHPLTTALLSCSEDATPMVRLLVPDLDPAKIHLEDLRQRLRPPARPASAPLLLGDQSACLALI